MSQHNIFDSEKLSFNASIQIWLLQFLPMIWEKTNRERERRLHWLEKLNFLGFLARGAVLDIGASILAAECKLRGREFPIITCLAIKYNNMGAFWEMWIPNASYTYK